ncbi:hypothetical protein Q9G87_03035 [Nonomuraea sp. G32]|nr:hypothetical protein [Nonomuraea sp. G32]MDP4500924.1 hypothetical protein [Nonomuraea sp. G32]
MIRTGEPRSRSPPGGSTPPTREISSRQSVYGSVAPPIWKVTCPCESETFDVAVYSNVRGVVVSSGRWSIGVVYGGPASWTVVRMVTSRLAEAVKRRVYGWPSSNGTSFWPIMESHGFVVPAGTSAHNRPDSTRDGVFWLLHQGSLPLSKLPFRRRS